MPFFSFENLRYVYDPSEINGFTILQDRIIDYGYNAINGFNADRALGFPLCRNILLTMLLGLFMLMSAFKIGRTVFFSYRTYIKAPILTLQMHDGDSAMLRSPSVTTATFYRGGAPLALIRRRLIQIIQKNPWLTARLVYEEGKYTYKYSGDWDSDLLPEYFEITDDRTLVMELDYQAVLLKMNRFVIGNGYSCVDKNAPLFKVSIVQNPSGFTFVMSLSHAIADGRTFYNIYGMFDGPMSNVRALKAERVQSFVPECEKRSSVQAYFKCLPFVLRIVYFMFLEPKQPKALIYKIQPDWIEAEKEAAKIAATSEIEKNESKFKKTRKDDIYVSTNDVLVSWWARKASFDYCMMTVDFRDRFQNITTDNAGNYSGAMLMHPDKFKAPFGIRSVVSNFLSEPEVLPTNAQTFKFNCGIATNWTKFYTEVTFNGTTLLRHIPIFLPGSSRFPCTMVLFCPKKGEIAALIGTSKTSLANKIFSSDDSPCGELLMKYNSK